MLDLAYPKVLESFAEHLDHQRAESASFLIWYLENYYRLDTVDAIDSVCDNGGDKGVDGIYVNDNDLSITVFQSRLIQSDRKRIGDRTLREFAGTIGQFSSKDALRNLTGTAGGAQVGKLVSRLGILDKLDTHDIRGVFLTNSEIDANGANFLQGVQNITVVGGESLRSGYLSDERNVPIRTQASFNVGEVSIAEYPLDAAVSVVIAPIKASELVALDGIADQSLFDLNVRGPLGRTQVNKDIEASVQDPAVHKYFPLFHNGITIVTRELEVNDDRLTIADYYVVNGCQSLTTLHKRRASLTDNLRILTKLIKVDPTTALCHTITRYSNNQNGVKARDFMSNSPIQIRLKNEFSNLYSDRYGFEIKRGEITSGAVVITNEDAGLWLMSFDLKQPWATHRKYQVFDDKYNDLFARKEVTADRIVMCQSLASAADGARQRINNGLLAKYVLTRYLLLYLFRCIVENDPVRNALLQNPEEFVRDEGDRALFVECAKRVMLDAVADINVAVDPLGDDFDYRGKLRDEEWVKALAGEVVSLRQKLINRGSITTFAQDWRDAKERPAAE